MSTHKLDEVSSEVTQIEKKEELNGQEQPKIEEKQDQEEEFKVNRSNEEELVKENQTKDEEKEKASEQEEKNEEENENNEQEEDQVYNNNEDDEDSQEEIPESERSLEKALEFKEKATKYFTEQLFDDAIDCYYKALKNCPSSETKQRSVLNSNLAICYLKKNDYETVIEYTSEAIKLDPTFKKPVLNRITAYEKSEKLEEAIEDLKELEKMDPEDKQIKTKIFIMQKDLEKLNEKRKTEVLSGLKDLGNTILGKFGLSLDNFKLNQGNNGSYNIQFSK